MAGRGKPQNKIDQVCRDYQLCLRCARFDGKEDGYGCDPKSKDFKFVRDHEHLYIENHHLKAGFYNLECSKSNAGDACGTHICSCSMDFFGRLIEQLWEDDYAYDRSLKHENGFNWKESCSKSNDRHEGMSCCGHYPQRYPYGLGHPWKQCCREKKIYNRFNQDCCSDGRVKPAGKC